jgi:hypothetical protein
MRTVHQHLLQIVLESEATISSISGNFQVRGAIVECIWYTL